MKNSDKPAAPFKEVISMQGGAVTRYDNHKGLTKREHFAAMAMQGFLSNSSWLMPLMQKANGDPVIVNCAVKELSYQLADKMLEEKQS